MDESQLDASTTTSARAPASLEDEAPELEPPELDVDELLDELLEDELEPAPELDELELEAASVTARLPPSSAGDSPSPSPI